MKYESTLQTARQREFGLDRGIPGTGCQLYEYHILHLKAAIPNTAAAKVPLLVVLVFALLSNQGLYMGQGYASSRSACSHDGSA